MIKVFTKSDYDLYRAAYEIRDAMGKKAEVKYVLRPCEAFDDLPLGENGQPCDGAMHRVALIRFGGKIAIQLVDIKPAKWEHVKNIFDGSTVTCAECDADVFFSIGRTLDYHLWVCAHCGTSTRTMTETGASA